MAQHDDAISDIERIGRVLLDEDDAHAGVGCRAHREQESPDN